MGSWGKGCGAWGAWSATSSSRARAAPCSCLQLLSCPADSEGGHLCILPPLCHPVLQPWVPQLDAQDWDVVRPALEGAPSPQARPDMPHFKAKALREAAKARGRVQVVGTCLQHLSPGSRCRIAGKWKQHASFGMQVRSPKPACTCICVCARSARMHFRGQVHVMQSQ